ncbi:hypothetical protein ACFL1X_08590 [Candidatus Hydrogenedentota bacterium]
MNRCPYCQTKCNLFRLMLITIWTPYKCSKCGMKGKLSGTYVKMYILVVAFMLITTLILNHCFGTAFDGNAGIAFGILLLLVVVVMQGFLYSEPLEKAGKDQTNQQDATDNE